MGAAEMVARREADVPSHLALAPLLAAPALLWFSGRFTWVHAEAGEQIERLTASDIRVLEVALALATLAGAADVLIGGFVLRRSRFLVLAAGHAMIAVIAGALLLASEMVAGLVPSWILPTTIRRLTVDVHAGWGIWVALLVGAAGVVVGLRPPAPATDLLSRVRTVRWSRQLAASGALLLATAAIAWARYQPWASAEVIESYDLAGWAVPWVGPLSLVAVWVCVLAAIVAVCTHRLAPALIAASSAWFVSILAVVTWGLAESLASVPLGRLVPPGLADHAPTARPSWGAAAAYASAVVAASSALVLGAAAIDRRERMR